MDEPQGKIRELDAEMKNYKQQLTDFVEAASHDLHAPLRKLSVLMERLVAKYNLQSNDGAKEYVERIQSCIREMRSLIGGLTELAQADGEVAAFEACDLNAVVKYELEMIKEGVEDKPIEVNVEELPVVNGIAFQYGQLFKNLFENAVKFSKKDAPAQLNIKAELVKDDEKKSLALEPGKRYYRIEIADNGIGFDLNYAEKIFQPFVRLHPRSEYEGSGIGLSICRKIVMNHKGRIFAEGHENRGSRFILILPESP